MVEIRRATRLERMGRRKMSRAAKDALVFMFGWMGIMIAFILVYGFVEYIMKPQDVSANKDDKCYIEVEGNENRKYPYYELHPMEDCEE